MKCSYQWTSSNQVIVSEVPFINFTSEVEESRKQDLKGTCAELANALETRLKTPPLFEALSNYLNDIELCYNARKFMEVDQLEAILGKLCGILLYVTG